MAAHLRVGPASLPTHTGCQPPSRPSTSCSGRFLLSRSWARRPSGAWARGSPTRRAGRVERQQIKWLAYGGALAVGAIFVGSVISTIWSADVGIALISIGLLGVPIFTGVAITRYRLYEIDIVINRTLVYGALTAALVAVYFGGVATLQALFRALTGQQSILAVVASTLLIAALFNPLRRRIKAFIDRRFYRRKYDAAKTLEAVSARLRDETDLQALNGDLTRVVRETMQPSHVSLWLRPELPPRRSEGSS
jgi:hypothetical protein